MKQPMPTREAASSAQLQELLSITQYLQAYLLVPPDDRAVPHGGPIDGGTVIAAASTFIKTCAKIDEILADKSRWNLDTSDALYAAVIKTQEFNQRVLQKQTEFLQTQTEAAASLMRPSFQLKPELLRVEGGYAAIHGNLTTHSAVVGYGATPEAAMADFDSAFQRQPEQQHKLETIEPTKQKKKK